MKEEKTQGINTETKAKDSYSTTKKRTIQNYLTLGRVTAKTPALKLVTKNIK